MQEIIKKEEKRGAKRCFELVKRLRASMIQIMSKYAGEQVLVVPRGLFEEVGFFEGVRLGADAYLSSFLAPKAAFFLDRDKAELDPSHKQIIAYAIFTYEGKILHYTRGASGGESRLHDKGSLGIGGHINPIDWQGEEQGESTYLAGVEREIEEELAITGSYTQKVIGLINDESNEVGKVHLGVIHRFELSSPQVASREEALSNLSFYTLEELLEPERFSRLESWSQLCVQALNGQKSE